MDFLFKTDMQTSFLVRIQNQLVKLPDVRIWQRCATENISLINFFNNIRNIYIYIPEEGLQPKQVVYFF